MATPYLQLENVTKSVGDRLLFGEVTLGINEGDKIGLIAKNGTGKSSLLKLIAGADSPDSGKIVSKTDLKISILEQVPEMDAGLTALEACICGESEVAKCVREYENAISKGDNSKILGLIPRMDAAQAWDFEERARQILTQCKITDLQRKVANMSGGERKRIALCRVLIENPDLLILDEPTNHLDISTVEWLESLLVHNKSTLLLVTHDRYFLDRVCNKIVEIDDERIYCYDGNYDYYLKKRAERIDALVAEQAKIRNTLRKEQEWMRRQPQARAGKAKFRIDAFHELQAKQRNVNASNELELSADKKTYIGNKIFEAKNVSKKYGDKIILNRFSYVFSRYEKLGIVGESGIGKSTFIKLLQGIEKPDEGEVEIGTTVRFGYYTQDGLNLASHKKVIDAITEFAEDIVLHGGQVHLSPMQFLTRFLFSPADQQKTVGSLSGGEKARLHLAQVLMTSPNFLILDEPTNDLDIVTLGILEDYLNEFNGCLIVVSHDRFFLDSIVDHIFVFKGNGQIKDFPGTYSEYREFQKTEAAKIKSETTTKTTVAPKIQNRKRKMTFAEKKEFSELEIQISVLTGQKAEAEKILSGEIEGDVAEASKTYQKVSEELDIAELRWLELSEIEG